MPSRREIIAMTPEEVAAYLGSQTRLILVSNGANGFPHPVPMNYAIDDQGRVLILTFRKSQKVKNFVRDNRAALLVESGDVYHELKSVMIYARAEIIDERTEFAAARAFFATKDQTRVTNKEAQAQIEATMAKRVIIRCTAEKVISWDHAKLGGQY